MATESYLQWILYSNYMVKKNWGLLQKIENVSICLEWKGPIWKFPHRVCVRYTGGLGGLEPKGPTCTKSYLHKQLLLPQSAFLSRHDLFALSSLSENIQLFRWKYTMGSRVLYIQSISKTSLACGFFYFIYLFTFFCNFVFKGTQDNYLSFQFELHKKW